MALDLDGDGELDLRPSGTVRGEGEVETDARKLDPEDAHFDRRAAAQLEVVDVAERSALGHLRAHAEVELPTIPKDDEPITIRPRSWTSKPPSESR